MSDPGNLKNKRLDADAVWLRRARLAGALCFFLAVLFCSVPVGAANGDDAASRNGSRSSDRRTMQIYFATTRLNTGSDKSPEYSGERHLDMGGGTVEYGIAGLLEPENIKNPSSASNGKQYKKLARQYADEWRKAPFTFVSKTDDEEFFKRLREWTGTICIYVHGYDKPFIQSAEDACMVFSDYQQYVNSPQKKLLPLLFSWPSFGGRTEYGTDEANLEWSGPAFDGFLERVIKEKNPAAQLDIVAHSMGVRLLIWYLSKAYSPSDTPIFRNIFLCSGDIDFHLMEMQKKLLDEAVSDWTFIFVSDRDKAMILSHFFHERPRLGRPVDPPKFTTAQRNQLFSSVYLEQLAVDTSDLLGGNSYTEPPDVRQWLAENPRLDREFSVKSRFIDVTDLITKDFGHGAPFPIIAAYMAGKGTPAQLKAQVVHKRPDRTTLKQSGGKPKYLYRYLRLEPY
jgi:esterase/lipase superfamily enzyme